MVGEVCITCNGTGKITSANLREEPCSAECKGGIKETTTLTILPWIVSGGKQFIPPGFKIYIFSMDMLGKYIDEIIDLKPKLLIVDESQHFKELNIKRTKALFKIAKQIPHRVLITGTPVLNCATEYFPSLNLIRPLEWYSAAAFKSGWIEYSYDNKKYTKIKNWRRDEFLEKTKEYVLRRSKSQIM
ncbi:hypothetical protein LCGC14_2188040, partial [marine sediment metagenome]